MPSGVYKHKPFTVETKIKLSTIAKEKNFGLWNKGRKLTKETKEKISKGNLGKKEGKTYWLGKHLPLEMRIKISEAHKGLVTWNKGKTGIYSEETKRNISKNLKGNKNWNWKGGKSFEEYTINFNKELKELIRQRDNYQCQLCGMLEIENIRKLHIHHINYDKKNCSPSNLISLCTSCHIKTNYNREYWINYFLKEEV